MFIAWLKSFDLNEIKNWFCIVLNESILFIKSSTTCCKAVYSICQITSEMFRWSQNFFVYIFIV